VLQVPIAVKLFIALSMSLMGRVFSGDSMLEVREELCLVCRPCGPKLPIKEQPFLSGTGHYDQSLSAGSSTTLNVQSP
jgi:hypothetical protein